MSRAGQQFRVALYFEMGGLNRGLRKEGTGPALEGRLLAVDVGLRTGLALYGTEGKLLWYRSHNLGTRERLRRAVPRIIREADDLTCLVLEGGGVLGRIWAGEAEERGIEVIHTSAEVWRAALMIPRERKDRQTAKDTAGVLARQVITWSGLSRPVRLRHDAAEAVLTGLWALVQRGLLSEWPPGLGLQARGAGKGPGAQSPL